MNKLFLASEVDKHNEVISLFGYKETKRKPSIFKGAVRVSYIKEEANSPYRHLEKQYMPRSYIPFIYVIISIIIAIALATTYLVLNFTMGIEFNRLTYFFIFMLPAFLFLLLATGLSFLRYFNTLKNIHSVTAVTMIKKEMHKDE